MRNLITQRHLLIEWFVTFVPYLTRRNYDDMPTTTDDALHAEICRFKQALAKAPSWSSSNQCIEHVTEQQKILDLAG